MGSTDVRFLLFVLWVAGSNLKERFDQFCLDNSTIYSPHIGIIMKYELMILSKK